MYGLDIPKARFRPESDSYNSIILYISIMKRCLLIAVLLASSIFARAQEIKPMKTDASDYVPMLMDAGFGVYAFDISSLNDNSYNISLVVSEYVNGELVSESELYEVESSLRKNPQKLTLGFSPKSASKRNIGLYVDDVRIATKTLSLKPMTAPQYEGEIMYDLLSFESFDFLKEVINQNIL